MGLLIARALQERSASASAGWPCAATCSTRPAPRTTSTRIGVDAAFISMFDREPPTDLDLLVVDEAQHDAASSMAHLHQLIRPRFILGLSATPFRADRVKLCFDSVLKDAGIQTLIQDGYLSPYHHYTMPGYTPAEVVELYLRDRQRWGKSLLYFHTLDQCSAADRPAEGGRRALRRGHRRQRPRGAAGGVPRGRARRADQLHGAVGRVRLPGVANGLLPAVVQGRDGPDGRPRAAQAPRRAGQADRAVRADALAVRAHGGRRGCSSPGRTATGARCTLNPLINEVNGRTLQAPGPDRGRAAGSCWPSARPPAAGAATATRPTPQRA